MNLDAIESVIADAIDRGLTARTIAVIMLDEYFSTPCEQISHQQREEELLAENAALKAERDEWKRRAELMRKWLRNDFNNYNTRWDALVDEFPEAANWFEENGNGF